MCGDILARGNQKSRFSFVASLDPVFGRVPAFQAFEFLVSVTTGLFQQFLYFFGRFCQDNDLRRASLDSAILGISARSS